MLYSWQPKVRFAGADETGHNYMRHAHYAQTFWELHRLQPVKTSNYRSGFHIQRSRELIRGVRQAGDQSFQLQSLVKLRCSSSPSFIATRELHYSLNCHSRGRSVSLTDLFPKCYPLLQHLLLNMVPQL